MAFADQHGVDAMSMRKLGRELGIEGMSLYNHVANKQEILDGIVDLVTAEIDLVEPSGDWPTDVMALAQSAHRALVAHRWVCGLWYETGAGPTRLNYAENLLAIFRNGGLSVELAHQGFHAINRHVLGFTSEELNVREDPETAATKVDEFIDSLADGALPHMVEHARYHVESPTDDSDFDFGVQLIIDGLLQAQSRAAT